MKIELSHFSAALVFAFFSSIVFGIVHKNEPKEMVRYGAKCFVYFFGGAILASWLMWLLKH
jgi:Na+/H+-dicarboxylate symporter